MMAKDSVQQRLSTGISFTEFSYPLLQAYDFYHLFTHHKAILQMGGSDQWGNLTTGIELIRRKTGKHVFACTTPLITKSDGSKFGKTETGNVWLDPEMTTPYTFYQFWLNCTDEEAKRFIKVFTLLQQNEITALTRKHESAPQKRLLQRILAQEVTTMVHAEDACQEAEKVSTILFGVATPEDVLALSEESLLSVTPQVTIPQSVWETFPNIATLLSTATQGEIFSSKGEALRMIQSGGVSINKQRITSAEKIARQTLLYGKYLLIQKGKKKHYLVVVES